MPGVAKSMSGKDFFFIFPSPLKLLEPLPFEHILLITLVFNRVAKGTLGFSIVP